MSSPTDNLDFNNVAESIAKNIARDVFKEASNPPHIEWTEAQLVEAFTRIVTIVMNVRPTLSANFDLVFLACVIRQSEGGELVLRHDTVAAIDLASKIHVHTDDKGDVHYRIEDGGDRRVN